MTELHVLGNQQYTLSAIASSGVSDREAFIRSRKMFQDLEAIGVSHFQIFNALAGLFYERGQTDVSKLMAEAAYQCFQRE